MVRAGRQSALARADILFNYPKYRGRSSNLDQTSKEKPNSKYCESVGFISKLIRFSGTNTSPRVLLVISFLFAIVISTVASLVTPVWLAFVVGISAFLYPFSYLDRKAEKRALEFAGDFPSILLATASSLSAGHTALVAIERSVQLIPEKNRVRTDIAKLLDELRRGTSKETALRNFATDIRLEELALFRSAFLLSMESGGRLSPTLERLAQVLKDRSILISSARTATQVMRMTSTVLLLFAPLIVGMVAVRTPNFLELLTHHPVASQVASLGFALIALNCWALRQMSDFRP